MSLQHVPVTRNAPSTSVRSRTAAEYIEVVPPSKQCAPTRKDVQVIVSPMRVAKATS